MAKESKRGRKAGVKQYPSLERRAKLLQQCVARSLDKVVADYVETVNDKRGVLTNEQITRLKEELRGVRYPHFMLSLQASEVFRPELIYSSEALTEQEHLELAEYHVKEAKFLKKSKKKGGKPSRPVFPTYTKPNTSMDIAETSSDGRDTDSAKSRLEAQIREKDSEIEKDLETQTLEGEMKEESAAASTTDADLEPLNEQDIHQRS